MSFCAHCGARAIEGAAFCSACGKSPSGAALRPSVVPSGSSAPITALIVIVVVFVLIAMGGIVAAIAIPNLLTATQRSKQKRTIADMRSLAVALEAYAADENEYPRATSVTELGSILTPTYISELPQIDGWGVPIRYECRSSTSEDSSARCDSYWLSSGGKNRAFETADPASTVSQGTRNFDCDIIYANGSFVQYPDGFQ